MKDPIERQFLEVEYRLGELLLQCCYALGIDKLVKWLNESLDNWN